MSELNSRQWALYNYLKDRGDEWTYQNELAEAIPEYDYSGEDDFSNFHDSTARMRMTADIRAINDSSVIQKIIISSSKGIKLANSEEFDRYIRKEIMASVRRLQRAKRKAEKGSRDGQMKITLGEYERDTVKAFIDSDKAFGERLKLCRIQKGYSQAEVIYRMREQGDNTFDAPMLSKLENGYCLPNKTTLARLAEIYDTTAECLLMGKGLTEIQQCENDDLQAVKGSEAV